MEHIYTIKVKRQYDPRGSYPSERRYSASTVMGLAWLHLAIATTAIVLAGLALAKPTSGRAPLIQLADNETVEGSSQPGVTSALYVFLAPTLSAIGALAAGIAAILASRRWYIDQNITWFFISSVVSTVLSCVALSMIVSWIVSTSENSLNFCDYFSDGNLFGKVQLTPENDSVVDIRNSSNNDTSWFYFIKIPIDELKARRIPLLGEDTTQNNSRRVLSVNILIAAAVEVLWSILSMKIAWRGMRSDYPDGESRRGPTVQVVTEIKGNNTKHLPKNTKILPPQPDLIEHHPKSNKIKKFFQSQQENGGFFLRANQKENDFLVLRANDAAEFGRRESGAEYKERIMTFVEGCEAASSWGDEPDHTVYDQNTLNLDTIRLKFDRSRAAPPDASLTTVVLETGKDEPSVPSEDTTKENANKET